MTFFAPEYQHYETLRPSTPRSIFVRDNLPHLEGTEANMPQPKPPKSLDNSCAVIHDGTLYVFTPEAFQAIDLKEGAKWKELAKGESVQGAACVGSPTDFWVVGGAGGATGMAKYTYSTGEWSFPSPPGQVTKDRQFHSSVYIKADDKILVFAGTRDGTPASNMETFVIEASEPYGVASSDTAAANSIRPILLNWSDSDAVMVGGDAANTKVYLFNPTAEWREFGSTLADPIAKDTTQMQAALIKGEDGSQSLYLFDMSESPNKVSRVVIQDAAGAPVLNSPSILERSLDTRQSDKWPTYDSSFAPDVTRQNFGIAQGDNGMIVFTGGNDQEPLSMFNGLENSWLNTTDVLVKDPPKKVQSASRTSSSTATSTSSTSTSSSTSKTTSTSSVEPSTTIASTTAETTAAETTEALVAAGESEKDDNDGLSSTVILGISLGSIFAFLIVLALILFLLRRRKIRRNRAAAAAAHDGSRFGDEKNPKAFANHGPGPLPTSPANFRGHRPTGSADSYSSMAILMGRVNQQNQGSARKASHDTGRPSFSHHRPLKSTISKPIPQEDSHPILQGQDDQGAPFQPAVAAPRPRNGAAPDPEDGTRRSSGWNRYWSGGSALQILGFGGGKRTTVTSEQSSRYSQASNHHQHQHHNPRVTQDSATVPPLNFEGRTAMNRVNSGSPIVTGHVGKLPFGEGVAGKIERPSSRASSGYSSGIPESVNEAWDPTDSTNTKPWGTHRAPSSAYGSVFSLGGSSNRAPPTGVSSQPQLAMASKSSDMSWLNLGEQRNDQSRI